MGPNEAGTSCDQDPHIFPRGADSRISFPGATQGLDASCERPSATAQVIGTPSDASIPLPPSKWASTKGYRQGSGETLGRLFRAPGRSGSGGVGARPRPFEG